MNYPTGDGQPEGPQIGGSPPEPAPHGGVQQGVVQPAVVQPGVGPGGAQAAQPFIGVNPGVIRRKKIRNQEPSP